MDSGDPDQAPGGPPPVAEAGPTLAPHTPAEGPGEGLAGVAASATGGSGLGLAPAPAYAPMAGDGLYARRPFNKRMPRDPVTNLRICFEFVGGACPRPPGTCRYSHNTPPQLLAAYQSMAMGTGAGGESVAAEARSLGVPFAPPLQQEPQPQPSTRDGEEAAGGSAAAAAVAVAVAAAAAAATPPMGAAPDGAEAPSGPASREYFLPHIRKSIMPIDTATQRRVCFYFNVMPEGCRKAADECDFAHVCLDGALQARRRAEAQGILPPITSTGSDGGEARQPPQLDQRAPQGWSGGVDPRMQQQQLWALSAGGGAVGAAGAAYAPSPWQHQQHAYAPPAQPLHPGLVAAAARDGVVYESRPTKMYVQMPRSARTGQRVCYYHNAGKCTARACPFLHVLVDMRALRAAAVVLPRSTAGGGPCAGVGSGSSSVGSDMLEPSATPYMQRMGSAPPLVAGSPTYTYPPEAYYAGGGGGYGSPGYASPGYPPSQYGGGSPPRPPHHHPPAAYGQQHPSSQPPMPPHGGGVQRHWTT